MPELCRFFGIIIRMFYSDHEPPHFHAYYGEHEDLIEIESLTILRGYLPRCALALILEWAAIHRCELQEDWINAQEGKPLQPIEPLD